MEDINHGTLRKYILVYAAWPRRGFKSSKGHTELYMIQKSFEANKKHILYSHIVIIIRQSQWGHITTSASTPVHHLCNCYDNEVIHIFFQKKTLFWSVKNSNTVKSIHFILGFFLIKKTLKLELSIDFKCYKSRNKPKNLQERLVKGRMGRRR